MMNQWVYIQSEHSLWTVGFYNNGKWTSESDHSNAEAAATRTNYLNGGNGYAPLVNQEVWINVRGGVAEVIHKPKGIIVIIKDWDNTPATEEKYTAQDEVEV